LERRIREELTVELAWITFVIAVALFVVVESLLVLAAWRLRGAAQYPEVPGHPPLAYRPNWVGEVIWTAIPAIGLLVLGALGLRVLLQP
jgi:heme/copper-type cytochrome/quinol oxidase subunit 2